MAARVVLMSEPDEAPAQTVDDRWTTVRQVRRQQLQWLLAHRIPQGEITIVEGDKETGKSTLLCALAAHVTGGRRLLGRKKIRPAHVVLLAGEDPYDSVVRPRLEAAGADIDLVHVPELDERGQRRRICLPAGAAELRLVIQHYRAALLILDPLSAHVPPEVPLTSDQETHSVLDPLADVAHETGCTIVTSRNLTKDRGAPALHRGLGGVAVAGVARSVLRLDWADRRTTHRVLWTVACNMTAERPRLGYELEDVDGAARLVRLRELAGDPDDDLSSSEEPGERDVRADARTLLRRVIGSEWVPYRSIQTEAQAAGIGERSLRAVKAAEGVRSRRVGGSGQAYWEWGPPAKGW